MTTPTVQLNGETYVIVEKAEYDRLKTLAKAAELPAADADGNRPAVAFATATIARDLIRDRVEAGLSQKDLAERAGVRVETLCRIEKGKHVPSVRTIEKLDNALKAAKKPKRTKRKTKRGK